MDCIKEIKNKMKYIKKITKDLRYELGDYEIEDMGDPHNKPPSASKLKEGYSAVYIFIYKDEFLKIGKANSKSIARFTSQHYGFSANSTLAKSLCDDKSFRKKIKEYKEYNGVNRNNVKSIKKYKGINKNNVKSWMLKNLWRINIYIKPDKEKIALAKTELIEAILHYEFRPRFEGNIH